MTYAHVCFDRFGGVVTFDKLTAFARRVAGELASAGVAKHGNSDGLDGWLVDQLDVEEQTLTGPDSNTELRFVSEELWLLADGSLSVRRVTREVVLGRGDRNEVESTTVRGVDASYARQRDGRSGWRSWTDKRGGGYRAEIRQLHFHPPSPDRPEFLALSAAISRIRPPGARTQRR